MLLVGAIKINDKIKYLLTYHLSGTNLFHLRMLGIVFKDDRDKCLTKNLIKLHAASTTPFTL